MKNAIKKSTGLILGLMVITAIMWGISVSNNGIEETKAESDNIFTDIAPDNKYYEAVKFLKDRGVVEGYADRTFRPEAKINRAEFLKLVMEGAGIGDVEGKGCFHDVGSQWFAKYVCFANEREWVRGYANRLFKPEKTINKAEAMKILVKVRGYYVRNHVAFESWYERFFETAREKGIMDEDEGKTPEDAGTEITRGEMSIYMWRDIKKLEEENAGIDWENLNYLDDEADEKIKKYCETGKKEYADIQERLYYFKDEQDEWDEMMKESRLGTYICIEGLRTRTLLYEEVARRYKINCDPRVKEGMTEEEIEEYGKRYYSGGQCRDRQEILSNVYYRIKDEIEKRGEIITEELKEKVEGYGCIISERKALLKGGCSIAQTYCNQEGELEEKSEKCEHMKGRCLSGDRKIALIEFLLPETDTSEPFLYDPNDPDNIKGKDLFYFLNNKEQLEFDNILTSTSGDKIVNVVNSKIYSFYRLEEKFEDEGERYGVDIGIDIDILGPYQLDEIPPMYTPSETSGYRKIKDVTIKGLINKYAYDEKKEYDLIYPLFFHSAMKYLTPELYEKNKDKWLDIQRLHPDAAAAYFSIGAPPNGMSYIRTVMHELGHNFCADDLYELNKYGLMVTCKIPEGLAEPFKEPLFPQRYASIMCGDHIYTKDIRKHNPKTGYPVEDISIWTGEILLEDYRFSPYTAERFGWIDDWKSWGTQSQQ